MLLHIVWTILKFPDLILIVATLSAASGTFVRVRPPEGSFSLAPLFSLLSVDSPPSLPIYLWFCSRVLLGLEVAREASQTRCRLCYWWYHGEVLERLVWRVVGF
ncbi:unnamed protein product [Brassica oleracea]